jgi:hypothetical protein
MIESEFADASRIPHDRLDEIGIASTLTCPERRSVLYKIRDERALRFRCQLGHGFSAIADLDVFWFVLSRTASMFIVVLRNSRNLSRSQDRLP